ncbi:hypothetical protein [Brevundimonas sp. NIBR11]|uniref:hypothetical protein n=1 Tax=Brevundimonas sp. NIBR11 TaxID=3015999 RepID=UPI0022F02E25|nr:hypothetical protein [Brevundimonas sp. NIBR11]
MLRALPIFGLLFLCWLASSTAEACSYAVPRNAGESEAHAYERLRQTNQNRYWEEADTIFVGRVVGLVESARGLEVRVLPRTSFKGNAGIGVIIYDLDGLEVQCDRAVFPDFHKVGLFYARNANGRLVVRGMLGPNEIEDDALKSRVIRQLTPGELTMLGMDTPPSDRRPLIFGGLIACCALVGGILIGRMSRKPRGA